MEQAYTATFCAAFFSILFVLAILVRQTTSGGLVRPNSALPPVLQFINTKKTNAVPWTTRNGAKVLRELKCISGSCLGHAYSIELPKLQNPERLQSQTWDTISNAWTLDSELFETGYPLQYPFATVVQVPRDTPDHVRYLLPELRPANEQELNVTGAYASAFALFNTCKHQLYFYRDSDSYWTLEPGSAYLLWPLYDSSGSSGQSGQSGQSGPPKEFWNAFALDKNSSEAQAAYFAEVLMFSRV
jgi:hypothetical protein